MNDNPINIESDSEGRIPYSLKRGMKSESHSLSHVNGDFESKVISLIDDSEMEAVSGDSFYKIDSSNNSL